MAWMASLPAAWPPSLATRGVTRECVRQWCFDLILRLSDFTAWRPILGQRFHSQFGPPPFDPVSIGLAILLARWREREWSDSRTELRSRERGLGYCRRFGFNPDDLPSKSTVRMAMTHTSKVWVLACADSLVQGLMAYDLCRTIPPFPAIRPNGAPV